MGVIRTCVLDNDAARIGTSKAFTRLFLAPLVWCHGCGSFVPRLSPVLVLLLLLVGSYMRRWVLLSGIPSSLLAEDGLM